MEVSILSVKLISCDAGVSWGASTAMHSSARSTRSKVAASNDSRAARVAPLIDVVLKAFHHADVARQEVGVV